MIASQGVNVIGVDRDAAGLAATASEVRSEFIPVVANLSDPASVAMIMSACGDRDVGVMMLNAGLGHFGPISDLDDSALSDYMFLMTTSYAVLAREFVARDKSRKHRAVLYMTASLAADSMGPLITLYCAVKAYESRFLKHIASETNVAVTAVHPGLFRMSKFFMAAKPTVQSWADRLALMPATWDVADAAIRTLGRAVLVDLTWFSVVVRCLLWALGELPMYYACRIAIVLIDWLGWRKNK
jgi:short-subunit dehydrogenase